ncbi:MAG: hypothetical protein ACI3XR_05780 [Eubacteriales bacterium]
MKRLISIILAGLLTAAAVLFTAGCQKHGSVPSGWEVVSEGDGFEVLSLASGSDRDQKLDRSYNHNDRGCYLDLYGLAEDDDSLVHTRDRDVTMIFYYGATESLDPNRWMKNFKIDVSLSNLDGSEYRCVLTGEVQTADLYDIRVDGDGEMYARHALRITVPMSEFEELKSGSLYIELRSYTNSSDYGRILSDSADFLYENGRLWLAATRYIAGTYYRHTFPNVLFENDFYINCAGLILAIVLFILLLVKNKFVWIPYVLCVAGVVYSFVAIEYWKHIPDVLFGGLFSLFGVFAYLFLIVIFFVIHLIVRDVRCKKAIEREIARKEAARREEMRAMEATENPPHPYGSDRNDPTP